MTTAQDNDHFYQLGRGEAGYQLATQLVKLLIVEKVALRTELQRVDFLEKIHTRVLDLSFPKVSVFRPSEEGTLKYQDGIMEILDVLSEATRSE